MVIFQELERVRRIWQEEGLKVPDKQHPRGRHVFGGALCATHRCKNSVYRTRQSMGERLL